MLEKRYELALQQFRCMIQVMKGLSISEDLQGVDSDDNSFKSSTKSVQGDEYQDMAPFEENMKRLLVPINLQTYYQDDNIVEESE